MPSDLLRIIGFSEPHRPTSGQRRRTAYIRAAPCPRPVAHKQGLFSVEARGDARPPNYTLENSVVRTSRSDIRTYALKAPRLSYPFLQVAASHSSQISALLLLPPTVRILARDGSSGRRCRRRLWVRERWVFGTAHSVDGLRLFDGRYEPHTHYTSRALLMRHEQIATMLHCLPWNMVTTVPIFRVST